MLLTSAQVSVAISSFIVFLFTTALFLSGYVLQQQTVRDLRAVIAPQISRPLPPKSDLYLPPQFHDDEYWEARGVVDSVLGEIEKERLEKERLKKEQAERAKEISEEDMVGATRWQKAKRRKLKEEAERGGQKPIIQEESKQKESVTIDERKVDDRPLGRAERRKKIKQQIIADGEGESFKGYRRRLW